MILIKDLLSSNEFIKLVLKNEESYLGYYINSNLDKEPHKLINFLVKDSILSQVFYDAIPNKWKNDIIEEIERYNKNVKINLNYDTFQLRLLITILYIIKNECSVDVNSAGLGADDIKFILKVLNPFVNNERRKVKFIFFNRCFFEQLIYEN